MTPHTTIFWQFATSLDPKGCHVKLQETSFQKQTCRAIHLQRVQQRLHQACAAQAGRRRSRHASSQAWRLGAQQPLRQEQAVPAQANRGHIGCWTCSTLCVCAFRMTLGSPESCPARL